MRLSRQSIELNDALIESITFFYISRKKIPNRFSTSPWLVFWSLLRSSFVERIVWGLVLKTRLSVGFASTVCMLMQTVVQICNFLFFCFFFIHFQSLITFLIQFNKPFSVCVCMVFYLFSSFASCCVFDVFLEALRTSVSVASPVVWHWLSWFFTSLSFPDLPVIVSCVFPWFPHYLMFYAV